MDERQAVEIIMEALGLTNKVEWLRVASESSNISMLTILSVSVETGIDFELRRSEKLSKERKERSKEKKENIYNNNKTKEEKLKESYILSGLNSGEKVVPPLEAKRQAAEKRKKNVRKVNMPKVWVDSRERDTIDDEALITYCERMGYDWYAAKEAFLAFVDHHMAKGSKFVKWNHAFFTWIRNDIKWKGGPITQKPGSVIQSYQPKNRIGELFND